MDGRSGMAQVAARSPEEEVGLLVAREGRQQRLSDDKRVRTLAGVLPMVEEALPGDELSDRHVFYTLQVVGFHWNRLD